MKRVKEQYLDNLSKKVIKSSHLETPSLDFTANIMSKIDNLSVDKAIVYKPLISIKGWIFTTVLCAVIVFSYFFFEDQQTASWFGSLDFSVLSNNLLTNTISGMTISKTLMYAIVFFGLAWSIQIPLMKHYVNKQLEF